MIKKKQLEIIAEKVLGVPFKYKGRDLSGLDCWGLVMYCYKELGIELEDFQQYNREKHIKGKMTFKSKALTELWKSWKQVKEPKAGDVVLFKGKRGYISHIAIYIGHNRVLNTTFRGTIIVRLVDINYIVEGYYRYVN